MPDLAVAVCSITPTQRRRFFWAAWWTGEPTERPFRKPDASGGGARTAEQALAEAERIAARHLVLIEPYWARAWNRVLRGERPPPRPVPRPAPRRPAARSAWETLGLAPGASVPAIKAAFRRRAFETHPDYGGDAAAFREVQRAYERLLAKQRGSSG